MENKERVRAKNFIQDEVKLLITLIEKHKDLIETKQNGAVTLKKKSEAWEQLAKEFNATSTYLPRTPKVLREKWSNIKKTAVRNCAATKKYRQDAEGAVWKEIVETSIDERKPLETSIEIVHDPLDERLGVGETKYEIDYLHNSDFHETPDSEENQAMLCQLQIKYMKAEEARKAELHELKKKYLQEEHELKMKFLAEEHVIRMKKIKDSLL